MMKKAFDALLRNAGFKKPKPDDGSPRYGDINERALAASIDILLLYAVLFSPFLWIQAHIFSHVNAEKLDAARAAANLAETSEQIEAAARLFLASYQPQLWVLNTLVQIVVIGIFVVGAQFTYGNTPGKYIMGLKVVDAKTLGSPKRWQYVLRYWAYVPAALPLMIGIFWTSFNSRHRGWHDYIAGTVVLNTRPRGWYWQQFKRGFRWCRKKFDSKPA